MILIDELQRSVKTPRLEGRDAELIAAALSRGDRAVALAETSSPGSTGR